MPKMISSSKSHFIVLLAIIHQSQSEENFQQNSKSNYWELKDSLNCYATATLGLFENMKKVTEVVYVESGKAIFESKFDPKSYIFPFHNYDDYDNLNLFRRTMNDVEIAARQGILSVRRSLEYDCTQEKPKQIREIINIFKEQRAKCFGAPYYLEETIWKLEQTCTEKKDERFKQIRREGSSVWKKQNIDRFRYR